MWWIGGVARLPQAKLEQQLLRGSSYLLSFLPWQEPWRSCGVNPVDGIVATILLHDVALLLLRSTRLSAWSIDYNYWSLQGSLAVRYRFDIRRTLSLRPPINLADERRLWQAARAVRSWPPAVQTASTAPAPLAQPAQPAHPVVTGLSGNLSFSGLEALWVAGGGPAWAEYQAAEVAECESGGQEYAHNPSGADGYWQILGQVVPEDIYVPMVNAENADSKFEASDDTFAQWVCQP